MAGKSAILTVKILSDASQAQKGMDQAASRVDKLEAGVSKLTPAALAVGAGLVLMGKQAVGAASELEQAEGAVEAVYGKASKAVDEYAKTSVDRLGLSEAAYKNYSALVGAALQNAGFSAQEAAAMSDKAMVRAGDMAATYGGKTSDAIEAINAAVSRGEFDPLEKYAVSLNATAVSAELAKRGQDDLTGAALKNAKAQATLDLIYKQTAKTAGQRAREDQTVAVQQEKLAAAWEDMSASLGKALLPAVTAVAAQLAVLATWMSQNTTAVYVIVGALAAFSATVLTLNVALKAYRTITAAAAIATKVWNSSVLILRVRLIAMAAAEKAVAAATLIWNAALKAAAIGMRILNAAMRANPLGLLVTAIMLAVTAIVILWKKNETFRNFMKSAWAAIANAAKVAWNAIKAVVGVVIDWAKMYIQAYIAVVKFSWRVVSTAAKVAWRAVKAIISVILGWAKAYIKGYVAVVKFSWKVVSTAAKVAWRAVKAVISTVLGWAKAYVKGYANVVKAAFRAIANAGKAAWRGIKAVISTVVGWAKSAIRGLSSVVNGVWRSIKSVATTVWNAIKSVVQNTITSIKNILSGLKSSAQTAFNAVKTAATTAFNAIKTPVNAVKTAIDKVISAAKSLIDWLGKIKVPKINLPGPLKKLSAPVPSTYGWRPGPTLAAAGAGPGGPRRLTTTDAGAVAPVVININGTLHDADAARAVRRVLRNDSRRRGGVVIERRRTEALG